MLCGYNQVFQETRLVWNSSALGMLMRPFAPPADAPSGRGWKSFNSSLVFPGVGAPVAPVRLGLFNIDASPFCLRHQSGKRVI